MTNRAGLMPGIDLRGDGGMIVAPPSVHPSGGRYRWRRGHRPGALPLAEMPDWLVRLCRGERESRRHPLSHWRNIVRYGVPEGQRNTTVASLTGHLLWHGLDKEVIEDLLLCWNQVRCRPPLREDEVMRTVDSIARTHVRRQD